MELGAQIKKNQIKIWQKNEQIRNRLREHAVSMGEDAMEQPFDIESRSSCSWPKGRRYGLGSPTLCQVM